MPAKPRRDALPAATTATAMLMGAAYLAETRNFDDTVVVISAHAEEGGAGVRNVRRRHDGPLEH
jgi:hypothetical protein